MVNGQWSMVNGFPTVYLFLLLYYSMFVGGMVSFSLRVYTGNDRSRRDRYVADTRQGTGRDGSEIGQRRV